VCCRLLICRSERRCTPARQFSGHSGSAHPAESKRRHMSVDTNSKRSYKAMVYIYFAWPLNCVMIPYRACVLKSEYQSSIGGNACRGAKTI
jgi:hypothetical protein